MRENVAHRTSQAAPRGDVSPLWFAKARRVFSRAGIVEVRRPFGRRHLRHTAKKTLCRPCAHEQETVGTPDHEGGAPAQRAFAFGYFARKSFRFAARVAAAAVVPWAESAGWFLRGADRGAEIHHRLGEIA